MAQIAVGGGWTTTITLLNTSSVTVRTHLDFYGDDGSALVLPFTFPQTASGNPATSSSLDNTLAPQTELLIQTTESSSQAAVAGWTQLSSDGNVTGYAVFSYSSSASTLQEALVPLESGNPAQFFLPFDNTNSYQTGFALANVTNQSASIPVTIRDDQANKIYTGTIALAAHGHTSYLLPSQYAATANIRGMVELDTPSGGQITVMGLRFNPTGAFSTLPPAVSGSAPGSANPAPFISSVSQILPQQTQTITVAGSGFGTQNAYNGGRSFLEITDVTGNWNAGFSNSTGANTVTLNVASWTDSQITIQGFTGQYGQLTYKVNSGDEIQVKVWNVQTETGPAVYTLTAGTGATAGDPLVTTASLPGGVTGTGYNQTLAASGGSGANIWSVTSGALPNGLTLSSGGVISGTPTVTGVFTFSVQVTDSASLSAARTLSITVTAPASGTNPPPSYLHLPATLTLAVIEPGMTTTLSWGSTYPTVTISPGIGPVASTGSINLSPTVTTQYIILYQAPGGISSQDTVTVTVVPPATINSFTATPSTISPGASSTLTWSTSNAHYFSIQPGNVGASVTNYAQGSINVFPTTTTTYTLTVVDLLNESGDVSPEPPIGATITKQVTVTVGPASLPNAPAGNGGTQVAATSGVNFSTTNFGSTPPFGGGTTASGTYEGTGTVTTAPSISTCLGSSNVYDSSADVTFTNENCAPSLYVFVEWNVAPYAGFALTIANGGTVSTGYLASSIYSRGGMTIFACPAGDIPVDSTGAEVSNPNSVYWCKSQ